MYLFISVLLIGLLGGLGDFCRKGKLSADEVDKYDLTYSMIVGAIAATFVSFVILVEYELIDEVILAIAFFSGYIGSDIIALLKEQYKKRIMK